MRLLNPHALRCLFVCGVYCVLACDAFCRLLLCDKTGALHDYKRAVLVGERTFGKGVVQYFFPLGDGSGLKLTVAKYLTPNMYDITRDGGLAPNIVCKDYPHGENRLEGGFC